MTDMLLPSAVSAAGELDPAAAVDPVDSLNTGPQAPTGSPEQVEEDLLCTVVRDETHDVKTFVLERLFPAPLVFRPGQYLTVTVDVDGEPMQRCYSIASSAARPGQVEITVKRTDGGPVSTWLHGHLQVGDRLRVAGPFGSFGPGRLGPDRLLLLSGGSGITPVMSMLRTLADRAEPADVVFLHSARTPDDIIFRRELEEAGGFPGFSVTVLCSRDSTTETWSGPRGRLSLRSLLRTAPDLHEREVFTCGPAGYTAAVRELLEVAAVDPQRCHEESYDLAARAADPDAGRQSRTPGVQRYAVHFRRRGRTVDCDADEPILGAARRAGLDLPSMCGQGMCGTCLTPLVEGEVDLQHAGGISRRQVEEGKILTCCSRPLGDLVLDA